MVQCKKNQMITSS